MNYPSNICVHGNGFVQISFGGQPEVRLHIWTEALQKMTQAVNTRVHNHRFGFLSLVLKGEMSNQTIAFRQIPHVEESCYVKWQAKGARASNGNRPLLRQPGFWVETTLASQQLFPGDYYTVCPPAYHKVVTHSPSVVTLCTKTFVVPESDFTASVYCPHKLEPDQSFDRYQIPFDQLLSEHIEPALRNTPFCLSNRYAVEQLWLS